MRQAKIPKHQNQTRQCLVKLLAGKMMPPDQADPDGVFIVPPAMRSNFPQIPTFLNYPVKFRIKGFACRNNAIGNHIMISAAFPPVGLVPLVDNLNVPEIGIRTMDYDLFNV
jgi:hypothetical protein